MLPLASDVIYVKISLPSKMIYYLINNLVEKMSYTFSRNVITVISRFHTRFLMRNLPGIV